MLPVFAQTCWSSLPAEKSEEARQEGQTENYNKQDLVADTFDDGVLILDQVVQLSTLTIPHSLNSYPMTLENEQRKQTRKFFISKIKAFNGEQNLFNCTFSWQFDTIVNIKTKQYNVNNLTEQREWIIVESWTLLGFCYLIPKQLIENSWKQTSFVNN